MTRTKQYKSLISKMNSRNESFFQKKKLKKEKQPFFPAGSTVSFPKESLIQKKGGINATNEGSPKEVVIVREKLLKLLKDRSMRFLPVIRNLNREAAAVILRDEDFWVAAKKVFKGKALWVVFTILYYNNKIPKLDQRLFLNMEVTNPLEFMDVLVLVFSPRKSDQYYTILKEVIKEVFKGEALLPQMLSLLNRRNEPNVVQRLKVKTRQAHYEVNEERDYYLKLYGKRKRRMSIYQTGNELRVVVRIWLINGKDPKKQPYYFFKDKTTPTKWLNAIRSHWNNKFILDNGLKKLNFTVVPMFFYEKAPIDKKVRVFPSLKDRCSEHATPGRPNAGCWFEKSPLVAIAHEFGHLIGAADEYNLPGSLAEIPKTMQAKLSATDLSLITVEGITGKRKRKKEGGHDMPGLMGVHKISTDVHTRYLKRLIIEINSKLPEGIPPYKVKKRL